MGQITKGNQSFILPAAIWRDCWYIKVIINQLARLRFNPTQEFGSKAALKGQSQIEEFT
jgi:hypothetical protein